MLLACAPTLPLALSEPELYGSWLALGTESDNTLHLFESEQAGWQHGYQRLQTPSGEDPQVTEEGSFTLADFELSFNPDGDGVPLQAQILGFDGEELLIEEYGLRVRYTVQP